MKRPKTEFILIGAVLATAAVIGLPELASRVAKISAEEEALIADYLEECRLLEAVVAADRPDVTKLGDCDRLAEQVRRGRKTHKELALYVSDLSSRTIFLRTPELDERLSQLNDKRLRRFLTPVQLRDLGIEP